MTQLAIDGGSPVRCEPFPRRLLIGKEEIEALHELLEKEQLQGGGFDRYGGEHVEAYEREFAAYHGIAYATATSSGTAAIHAALGALRLDIAQEVISSPITDPGGVAPILWNNCIPIFADANAETMNVDPASIAGRITERTRAIIVAHLAGQPADRKSLAGASLMSCARWNAKQKPVRQTLRNTTSSGYLGEPRAFCDPCRFGTTGCGHIALG